MKRYVFDEGEELVFGQPPTASTVPGIAPGSGESMGSLALRAILRKLQPRIALARGEVQWSAAVEADVIRALFPAGMAVPAGGSSMMLAAALAKRQKWVMGAMPAASVPAPGMAP